MTFSLDFIVGKTFDFHGCLAIAKTVATLVLSLLGLLLALLSQSSFASLLGFDLVLQLVDTAVVSLERTNSSALGLLPLCKG